MSRVPPDLPPAILGACFAAAERAYPREACGLLSGPKGRGVIDAVRVCDNDQDRLNGLDPVEFARDGRTAFRLRYVDVCWLLASRTTDRPTQIVFHSHVDVGADFSMEDRDAALAFDTPDVLLDQLVIDVTQAAVRGAALYRFAAGEFVRIAEYDAAGQRKRCDERF